MVDGEPTMQGIPPGGAIFNSDDSLAVIAWRLGALETLVGSINGKFDGVANLYVNHASLMLTLEPMKQDVKDLQEDAKNRDKEKNQFTGQLKLILIGSISSPIVSAVVATVIVSKG